MSAEAGKTEGQEPQGRQQIGDTELIRLWETFKNFTSECQNCQTSVPIDWQYCAQCGLRLATQCPRCNNPLPPVGGRFCPHCGLEIPLHETQP